MTTRPDPKKMPDWPRLMAIGLAALYLGVPRDRFRATVPVAGLKIGSGEMWDRQALDAWVDSLSQPEQHMRKGWLEKLDGDGQGEHPRHQ